MAMAAEERIDSDRVQSVTSSTSNGIKLHFNASVAYLPEVNKMNLCFKNTIAKHKQY